MRCSVGVVKGSIVFGKREFREFSEIKEISDSIKKTKLPNLLKLIIYHLTTPCYSHSTLSYSYSLHSQLLSPKISLSDTLSLVSFVHSFIFIG